jgi:hypothetical protein
MARKKVLNAPAPGLAPTPRLRAPKSTETIAAQLSDAVTDVRA